jgi:hypothetical protein
VSRAAAAAAAAELSEKTVSVEILLIFVVFLTRDLVNNRNI